MTEQNQNEKKTYRAVRRIKRNNGAQSAVPQAEMLDGSRLKKHEEQHNEKVRKEQPELQKRDQTDAAKDSSMKKRRLPDRHVARKQWIVCYSLLLLVVVVCLILLAIKNTDTPGQKELKIPQERENGETIDIPVTAYLPAGRDAVPLVVFCHGFTGNRQLDGHYLPMAQQLAAKGIASVSLDFPGNGESTEEFESYTIQHMQDDITCVIDYMCQHYKIAEDKIGILGHSMGGRVVSLRLDSSIKAAALWSPADRPGLEGLEFVDHDAETLDQMRVQAMLEGSVLAWNVPISSTFIEEMANSNPLEPIQNYEGALLLAFTGQDEELFSRETIDMTMTAARSRELPFVDLSAAFPDSTHNYTAKEEDDSKEKDAEIRGRIESQTIEFFCDTLL